MLLHYGRELGLRNMRKHFGSYVLRMLGEGAAARAWRQRLCETDDPLTAHQALNELFDKALQAAA